MILISKGGTVFGEQPLRPQLRLSLSNLEELNYQHSQPLVDTSSGSGQFQVAPLKIGQLLRDHSQHKLIPTVPTRVLIRRSAAEELLNEDCLAPTGAMPNRPHILTQRVQLYTHTFCCC